MEADSSAPQTPLRPAFSPGPPSAAADLDIPAFHEVFEEALLDKIQEEQAQAAAKPRRGRKPKAVTMAAAAAAAADVPPSVVDAAVPPPPPEPTAHEKWREEMRKPLPPAMRHSVLKHAEEAAAKKDPALAQKKVLLERIQRYYNYFPERVRVNHSISYKSSVEELKGELSAISQQMSAPQAQAIAKMTFLGGVGLLQMGATLSDQRLGTSFALDGPIRFRDACASAYEGELRDAWFEYCVEENLLVSNPRARLLVALAGIAMMVREQNLNAIQTEAKAARIRVPRPAAPQKA